jgi:DNA-binding NarL/FixJ family response regulator
MGKIREHTTTEAKIVKRMFEQGYTYKEIGEEINRSESVTGQFARNLGLRRNQTSKACEKFRRGYGNQNEGVK